MVASIWLRGFIEAAGASPTMLQLYNALTMLGYDLSYEEERESVLRYLADFKRRHGQLSPDNLLAVARRFAPVGRALTADAASTGDDALLEPQTPEEADTLFTLAVLGELRSVETASALLPYLTSPRAQERWLAAFALAAKRDERALPALGTMLVEFIGPDQPRRPDGSVVFRFVYWHADLPRILADWGDPRAVPLLRAALIATVRAGADMLHKPQGPEQEFVWSGRRYTGREAWSQYYCERSQWVEEEHCLVYALGRLGAFGALAGIPTRPGISYYWGAPPTEYRVDETGEDEVEVESSLPRVPESHADVFQGNTWRVHACCGFLEPLFRDRLKWIYFFADAPEFAEAIERLLEGQFGLDEAERRQAMEDYEVANYLEGTVGDYERLARQALESQEGAEERNRDG